MKESAIEIAAGAAVLAVGAGFLVFMLQSAGVSASSDGSYELSASFRSAEGVLAGTDIRLAGVKIGSVTDMSLNTQTYRADVTLSIEEGIGIPDDSVVVIATEGLLGGTYVDIVPGGSFDNVPEGGDIVNTQGAISVIGLLSQFVAGGDGPE